MIRSSLSLLAVLFLCSCANLQPVNDQAKPATLILPHEVSPDTEYAAPVFSISLPSYMNESTVWYADENGSLTSLPNFIWAESLSRALQREMALALSQKEPYPPNQRVEITFARFILLSDGSGLSICELIFSSTDTSEIFPISKVLVKNIWDPEAPASYLKGYQTLLQSTVSEILKVFPRPTSETSQHSQTSE
ncbi:ABC-type transport auxiliary lipoprotein family protein [Puniceicoccus vermicola]|uniref:Membrane integrity-associated transporter subunit PqiC n=1 Tax=Puniceicoccus vermicola TaxID=388746 RepID=A0A7X1B2F7_9BACT|nr:ABC-type transport auxiliary lipoprotein family protein [Puniceicoccus vermicola]MBC2604302.1 membrane integrity-associated transporter subunit PqiC [Puniceicoccus vermicola]